MSQGYEMEKHRADMLKGHLETANRRVAELEAAVRDVRDSLSVPGMRPGEPLGRLYALLSFDSPDQSVEVK